MASYIRQRGTLDIYETQGAIYQKIEQACKKVASKYNYKLIQTPMFESTALYTRSTGESSDIVTKEMYSFLDKGGRDISLRPEGTAGVIRAVIENKLYATNDLPLKYFYLGSFFRYERPQAGRYREFMQFGVEVVGSNSYLDDVESICLLADILKEVGISDYKVKINSFGNTDCRLKYRDVLKDYFAQYVDSLCGDCKNRLQVNPLRILDCKIDKDFFMSKDIPTSISSLDEKSKEEFDKVQELLTKANIPFEIDNRLVRGLDYYTGIIFEFDITSSDGKTYTIGGGGRYSNLVKELGGPDLNCVGFGLGVNRLSLILEDKFGLDSFKQKAQIYVMPLSEICIDKAFEITRSLRDADCSVVMENTKKSVSSMFKYASRQQFNFAIIIGEDELNNNVVNVKNLYTQEQVSVSLDKLIEFLRG